MSDPNESRTSRVIDFHTHIFREDMVERAMRRMTDDVRTVPHYDGTVTGLIGAMDRAGIAVAVLAPVATAARQVESINTWTAARASERLVPFGAMHPDYPDPGREIARMAALGMRGIKLHAEFQAFHPHEERLLPVYRAAEEHGMILLFHAGEDPAFDTAHGSPRVFRELAAEFPGLTFVLAHMGGYRMWDEVAAELVGRNVYLDTSQATETLPHEQVAALIRAHGVDKVLFASDGPWADAAAALAAIRGLGLPAGDVERILWGNAAALLGLA